ncbi:inhibitory synaptic factor 1 isoform X3 [Physeter macrocephalus]|uniref:Inhibitory synaptic factor 1 n=1 Tax=Physeter macrocephalus TaxID=9755 RepID=A0A455C6R9_PHYMC|nr:inhibitory synaptic factor 1 isoform X3 [Physeter catodon]|eukprot:XP_028351616.1 inhibitory synaptic factor 1 isoform X3 [Physeter catodon]
MNIRGTPDLGQPSDDPSSGGERERIRQRMKMVIGQLEDILRELKEVAKELREVVSQIDKLTSDFDFELEPDDWTTATVSSTSSSDKVGVGGPFDLGHLDFMTADILSDSWEFCSFLDISTPSDSVDGPESTRPGAGPDYRLMNGGMPIPNGPRVETPDSSSEEAFSAGPVKGQLPQRTPGTRERVRFSDKVLYHALCCDDEEGDGEEEQLEFRRSRQLASLPLAQIREGKETYRIVSISPRKKQTQSQGSLTEPWISLFPRGLISLTTSCVLGLVLAGAVEETEGEGGSFPLWTTIPWCSTSRASYPQTPAHLPFTLPDPASTPKKLLLQWITSPLRAGTIAVLPGADTGLAHKASLQDRGMNSYFLIKESSNSPCSYSINPLEHQPQRQLIH